MPSRNPTEPAPRAAFLAVLLLAVPGAACSDRAGAEQGADYAADLENGDDTPASVNVDPCGLLTREEISEQLYLSLPQSQRDHYSTPEFDVETDPADYGASRMCAYRFQSRDSVGGGPTWHSDFDLMVFPSNAIALPEDRREPLAGAGSGMFKERGTAAGYYVVKGGLAVSITRFPGRQDDGEGGPDAGRVVLLRRIAERLP
ncbi:MAG TPA: hypothetical protein VFT04_11310 [Gemmatimonadales bacterium]|nr:hypothetical protein [Gemmatimonadales bacterium]